MMGEIFNPYYTQLISGNTSLASCVCDVTKE